ncbi:GNAT family N-acetyltransferase [Paenibacillus sp. SYP-B4298]|uniref:GNAT family N-acetyltransferase n=1 Tax=Paenibacillus sp. SYP-B4298 TaxID=2996034 RepID=UPI0022DCFDC4|nr:GNAT family N-acetyltransferase [Paenibacillus sp. SYP-B4298]
MIKRVENELELAMFNGVWTTVWMEKGFELDVSKEVLDRFVIVTEEGHYVGAAEIKPYSMQGRINEVAPFQEHPAIRQNPKRVAEIDKIAVLKPYRGRYIRELLSSTIACAEKREIRYYVALMEPVFLRALRITYGVPYEKLGSKRFYKGDDVIPVLLMVEEIYKNKQHYPWLIDPRSAS